MRLVQRQRDADLTVVPRDDRRALAEAGIEHGLGAAALDLGELGGHVGVGGAVGFVGDDLDRVLGGDLQALGPHRFVEAAAAGNHCRLVELAQLQVDEYLLAGHPVGVRRLEDPLLDRLDDHDSAGQRDEWRARLFDERHGAHGGSGGGTTDDDIDLVLLDQALGESARLLGITAIVIRDQLKLAPEHTAFGVDAIDVQFQRFQFGVSEESGGTRHRQERADSNRLLGRGARAEHCAGQSQRCDCKPTCRLAPEKFHCHRLSPEGCRKKPDLD